MNGGNTCLSSPLGYLPSVPPTLQVAAEILGCLSTYEYKTADLGAMVSAWASFASVISQDPPWISPIPTHGDPHLEHHSHMTLPCSGFLGSLLFSGNIFQLAGFQTLWVSAVPTSLCVWTKGPQVLTMPVPLLLLESLSAFMIQSQGYLNPFIPETLSSTVI